MRPFRIAAVLAVAPALAACSSVLGFEDLQPYSPEAGDDSSSSQDSAGDDQSAQDSDTPDAEADAAVNAPDSGDVQQDGCGDTTSDKKNCGACGHDCLGGECNASVCQPVMLLGGLETPWDMALDDTYVYVVEKAETGRLLRVPKLGGNQKELASGYWMPYPRALALDSASVFFGVYMNDGNVFSCPLDGCVTGPASELESGRPESMLRLGDKLFWTEQDSGHIQAVQVGADAGTSWTVHEATTPHRLIEHGGLLYYTEQGTNDVVRMNLDGSEPVIISAAMLCPWGITANDTYVYWATESVGGMDGALWRWPIGGQTGGSQAQPILQGSFDPRDVVADADRLYWLTPGTGLAQDDGQVLYCPAEGLCANATLVAGGQGRPGRMLADAKALYWLNLGPETGNNQGSLWMVAKPL